MIRILGISGDSAMHFIRMGIYKALAAAGHQVVVWQGPEHKPALEIFDEVHPDLYLGCTFTTDRAIVKALKRHNQCRVAMYASALGPMVDELDPQEYPIVRASEAEKRLIGKLKDETGRPDLVYLHLHGHYIDGVIGGWKSICGKAIGLLNGADCYSYLGGQFREELRCDASFCGGYWPYKGRNLDRYLTPLLHESSGINLKIYGNQPWGQHVYQYLGTIGESLEKDLIASSKVVLGVCEPHSDKIGDLPERHFKTLLAGSIHVSDWNQIGVDLLGDVTLFAKDPRHYYYLVKEVVNNPGDFREMALRGRQKVLRHHTYFNRAEQLFRELGLPEEADKVRNVFNRQFGHLLEN